jgi:hypothetical protein
MAGVATHSSPSQVKAGAKVGSGTAAVDSSSCGRSDSAGINSPSLEGTKPWCDGDAGSCCDGAESFLRRVEVEKGEEVGAKRQARHWKGGWETACSIGARILERRRMLMWGWMCVEVEVCGSGSVWMSTCVAALVHFSQNGIGVRIGRQGWLPGPTSRAALGRWTRTPAQLPATATATSGKADHSRWQALSNKARSLVAIACPPRVPPPLHRTANASPPTPPHSASSTTRGLLHHR